MNRSGFVSEPYVEADRHFSNFRPASFVPDVRDQSRGKNRLRHYNSEIIVRYPCDEDDVNERVDLKASFGLWETESRITIESQRAHT